jgi:hypothetical protein
MLRQADANYGRVVAYSNRIRIDLDSWLGDGLLAESIPLQSGTGELAESGDQAIPERLTITVPARDNAGNSWVPSDYLSPLSQHGQRLYVTHNVVRGNDSSLVVGLGWYVIQDWDQSSAGVEVEAVGLLQLVADSGLITSTSPPAGATFSSELIRLVDSLLPVDIDAALVDRAVPANMAWQDDRLQAISQLLAAWPARMFVDEAGVLNVAKPYASTDAAELTLYQLGGTVIDDARSGSRDGLPSLIIARGENAGVSDRAPVVAYAGDYNPSSPTYIPRYGIKTEVLSSPLLTTVAQCQAAANTRLSRSQQSRVIPVTTYPDARIRPGVRIDLQYQHATPRSGVVDDELVRCRVLSSRLALTAGGGAQNLELAVIP